MRFKHPDPIPAGISTGATMPANRPAALRSTHCLRINLQLACEQLCAIAMKDARGLAEFLRWHCLCHMYIMIIVVSTIRALCIHDRI